MDWYFSRPCAGRAKPMHAACTIREPHQKAQQSLFIAARVNLWSTSCLRLFFASPAASGAFSTLALRFFIIRLLIHREAAPMKMHQQEEQTTAEGSNNNSAPPPSSATPVLKEGSAEILLESRNVFYNPVQQFNRDLSIAVLAEHSESLASTNESYPGLDILEGLSATGLRSIRYAKELPRVRRVVANDLSARAVQAIAANVAHNGCSSTVEPSNEDANLLMYRSRIKPKQSTSGFDAVDLDPYGCPSTFLDAAVQCVREDGILLVTATDMAVLAGNAPDACYLKYGALPLKSKCCHELALRILLQHVASHAARHGRYITPLLSISADFYVRLFLKLGSSQTACKANLAKLGYAYQCTGCESITLQPLVVAHGSSGKSWKPATAPTVDKMCEFCGRRHQVAGPIWTGPLHDRDFVSRVLKRLEDSAAQGTKLSELGTLPRIIGVLNLVCEELESAPLYYQLDRLASLLRCNVPPMLQFRSAILNAGYKVSYSHANKNSVKTDAPNTVIWQILRAWEREHPINRDKLEANSVARKILEAPDPDPSVYSKVSFVRHPEAEPASQQKKLLRFQMNPNKYWGPGSRSTTIVCSEAEANNKSAAHQNKRKNKKRKLDAEDASEETLTLNA